MEMNEKIKMLRQKYNLTLEEVGNSVGVGKSTVRKWENGDIANMRRDKIAKLAIALHTTPAYLLGWEEPENFLFQDEIKKAPTQSVDAITFDDFTYAMHNEAKDLTPENKQKLLELAQFFKEQQQKESGEENK